MTNKEIAKTFQYLGNIMELHGENKFKIRSYQSAYIALRKLDRPLGEMSDEEVVVVADVFGNGIANIAEVVDPPEDEAAMRELRRAFETNPEEAPFLPSRISEDSDAVRVVLKIQRVDVSN